jgi:hypothetical protein
MKNYRFTLRYGLLSDWFLPSRDEMYYVIKNIYEHGLGNFGTYGGHWTSSESNASNAYLIFTTGPALVDTDAKSASFLVRLCRSFEGSEKDYPLRSLGISGGYIFYHANGLVYECAAEDLPITAWSNVTGTAVTGTGTAIGTGITNTPLIIAQTGHTASAANLKNSYTNIPDGVILRHAPAGWDEKTITFSRHEFYHSVLRSYSLNLRFVFEAVPFILAAYSDEGINAIIDIKVEKLKRSDFTYEPFYDGILDLSEMKQLPEWIEVPIIDNDTLSRFVSRDDMDIEMNRTETLDGDAITTGEFLDEVLVNGVEIHEIMEGGGDGIVWDDDNILNRSEYFGVTDDEIIYNEIGDSAQIPIIEPEFLFEDDKFRLINNKNKYTVSVVVEISCKVNGSWELTGDPDYSFSIFLSLAIRKESLSPVSYLLFTHNSTGPKIVNINEDLIFAHTFSLDPDESLYVFNYYEASTIGVIIEDVAITDYTVKVTQITPPHPDTETNLAIPLPLFERSLEILSGNTTPISATILNKVMGPGLTCVASGFMLRRFPFNTAPLKIKFRELFKSFSNVFNLGFFFNGSTFEIKKIEEYYKEEEIAFLGEVKALEISVATEKYFNEITTGYEKDISHESVNGLTSTNVRFSFINSKLIKSTLDISAPYSADDYSIELARKMQYTISGTEDTRYDNNNYLLFCRRSLSLMGEKTAQGYDTFEEISGVPAEDTRLNLDITPKRNMLRCSNRVSVGEYISENDTKYISSKTTRKLITKKKDLPAVEEHADVAYSDLDDPLYHPVFYNFQCPVTAEIIQAIIADPHGYFRFTFKGQTYGGFIHEVSTEPFQRQGNWTLLKVPFEVVIPEEPEEPELDPDLVTYMDGLVTPLSSDQVTALDVFFKGVKSDLGAESWAELGDMSYLLAGETQESSLRNMNQRDYDAENVNSLPWEQYEGYVGTTGSAIKAGLKLSALPAGAKYTQNNASMGTYIYSINGEQGSSSGIMGVTGSGFRSARLFATGASGSRMNDNTNRTLDALSYTKINAMVRSAADNYNHYRNQEFVNHLSNSVALSNIDNDVLITAFSNTSNAIGVTMNATAAFYFAWKSLTLDEMKLLEARVDEYLTYHGKL